MVALGAGLAVLGAWLCVAELLKDDNMVARDMNSGCIWLLSIFAALATGGLIDAVSGK
jgi:hypothetical protein